MTNLRINKNKNIGKVVFIVEGNQKEMTLLGHIFTKIFDYSLITVRRGQKPYEKYQSISNKNSQVFVIASEKSNISTIKTGQDYLDAVFTELLENYELQLENSAIYYIFDRDPESNSGELIESLMDKLQNSRDNGVDSNGLLLMSYPSVEAHVISCFDGEYRKLKLTAQESKSYLGQHNIHQNNISDTEVVLGATNMLLDIVETCHSCFDIAELDHFGKCNKEILNREDEDSEGARYRLLSLLSIALLDLGLLVVI